MENETQTFNHSWLGQEKRISQGGDFSPPMQLIRGGRNLSRRVLMLNISWLIERTPWSWLAAGSKTGSEFLLQFDIRTLFCNPPSWVYRVSSLGGKVRWAWRWPISQCTTEVQRSWICTTLSQLLLWCFWLLHVAVPVFALRRRESLLGLSGTQWVSNWVVASTPH